MRFWVATTVADTMYWYCTTSSETDFLPSLMERISREVVHVFPPSALFAYRMADFVLVKPILSAQRTCNSSPKNSMLGGIAPDFVTFPATVLIEDIPLESMRTILSSSTSSVEGSPIKQAT